MSALLRCVRVLAVLVLVLSGALGATGAEAKLTIGEVQMAFGPLGPTRPSAEFVPGDEIFFRCTATGVKTDAAGKPDLELRIQVQDAGGKEVVNHKEALA